MLEPSEPTEPRKYTTQRQQQDSAERRVARGQASDFKKSDDVQSHNVVAGPSTCYRGAKPLTPAMNHPSVTDLDFVETPNRAGIH
jgi:hypothetical protein